MPYTLTRPAFTKFTLARTTESPKTKNTTRKLRRKHLNSQASESLKTLLIEVTKPIFARRRSFIKTKTRKFTIMSLFAVAGLIANQEPEACAAERRATELPKRRVFGPRQRSTSRLPRACERVDFPLCVQPRSHMLNCLTLTCSKLRKVAPSGLQTFAPSTFNILGLQNRCNF